MPQRFLRPEIRTSERWNETSFGAQSLYVGLMTLVDDFGRYDGRSKLIHGEVFILRDDVKPQQTAAWLKELDNRDLLQIYDVDGKTYIQISRWKERSRSETSRFPDPPDRESCVPLRNPAESCLLSLSHKSSPLVISHKSSSLNGDGFDEFWSLYPNKQKKLNAKTAWNRLNKSETVKVLDGLACWIASEEWARDNGKWVPHPCSFLNQRRWEDKPRSNGSTAKNEKFDKELEESQRGLAEYYKKKGITL